MSTLNIFRTMTDRKDENGNLLPDEMRLMDFVRKLRSTSLGELPKLINILKGDLPIVGDGDIIAITKNCLDFTRALAD
ncbi:sugar transferase [Enterocloster sp. OA13]|nr:sugar transferase [Enterocloster sp. OA13]